jgi:glycerol-3-phosphate cytidylyltransferase-like family protein
MLESIKYIDKVFIFDSQEQMCNIVRYNSIDAIVVGEEYRNSDVTASNLVKDVIYFPKIKGYSTTSILDQK